MKIDSARKVDAHVQTQIYVYSENCIVCLVFATQFNHTQMLLYIKQRGKNTGN